MQQLAEVWDPHGNDYQIVMVASNICTDVNIIPCPSLAIASPHLPPFNLTN